MNIRPLESLTKEELIELVKHEREHIEQPLVMVPEGFKLVPVEPTESMLEAGTDVEVLAFGEKHTFREVSGIYAAMLAAAPQPDHIPDATKMVEPTDTEMLDWLIEESCTVLSFATGVLSRKYKVIDFHGDDVSVGDTAREAIVEAMRGEE